MRFLFAFLLLAVLGVQAQKWTVTQEAESLLGGVSFPTANVGYITGSPSTGGAFIWKTADGGNTWSQIGDANNSLILWDIDMGSQVAGVASGMSLLEAADQYTVDGQHFVQADDKYLQEQTQSVSQVKGVPNSYILTGTFGATNGIAVTKDGGKTYEHIDAKFADKIPARYGSAPAENLYIITGGTWPNNDSSTHDNMRAIGPNQWIYSKSRFIHHPMSFNKEGRMVFEKTLFGRIEELFDLDYPTPPAWAAVVQRSADAGKTWQTTFWNETFYFNDISCPTAQTCFAVGEDDNNGYIYTSIDSGLHWELVYTATGGSLMCAHFLTDLEGWVGGGMNEGGKGLALHTIDGGKTWKNAGIEGVYFADFSFTSPSHGWATAFDADGASIIVKYA